ncbi:MAG: HAD hydrolase-like protein [Candidatus Eisenbacteria bacterium]|nr:HAD hydrolase-like protein [Candidatus Eisenbacteria bacterium]
MTPTPHLAWLFDIDGTLLLTEGASRQAFTLALSERCGIDDDLKAIRFDGRTEPLILADILAHHHLTFGDGDEARFWNAVFVHMRTLLVPPRGHLLPGVPEVIERVAAEPAWVMGLLTGNMTEMASIKLARFGLADRFRFGVFGEQASDRNALARLVVAQVARDFDLPPERCVVVGDTEHDVACARAAGAHAVAVATGSCSRAVLEAEKPDLLLDDLSDVGPLIEWARGLG